MFGQIISRKLQHVHTPCFCYAVVTVDQFEKLRPHSNHYYWFRQIRLRNPYFIQSVRVRYEWRRHYLHDRSPRLIEILLDPRLSVLDVLVKRKAAESFIINNLHIYSKAEVFFEFPYPLTCLINYVMHDKEQLRFKIHSYIQLLAFLFYKLYVVQAQTTTIPFLKLLFAILNTWSSAPDFLSNFKRDDVDGFLSLICN